MNELQLKQEIFKALQYADIYNAITTISIWGIIIAFFVTAILIISKYVNFFENRMDLEEPFMKHIDLMAKLSGGALIAFGTLACVFPSKDSKLSEAEAYISQLPVTPQNQVYVYSLSKKYDIGSLEAYQNNQRANSEQPAQETVAEVAVEVTASEPVVEKTN